MRIISDFKDYYDCLQRLDQDKSTIFLRNKEDQIILEDDKNWTRFFDVIIGFCGKTYVGKSRWVVTPADIEKWKDEKFLKPSYDCLDKPGHNEYEFSEQAYQEQIPKSRWWGEHTFPQNLDQDLADYFIKYGPIWTLTAQNPEYGDTDRYLQKNDNLGNWGFAKVLPPNQAYQELQRWVYNQASPPKPIPEMSNDVKIHQAGFNTTTSFRGSNGPKRKNKRS